MSNEEKRILVLEDNIALASVVRFNLQAAGFMVETGKNGKKGIELFEKSDFDLVITDQQMPVMTGVEFCTWLREQGHQTPVILLTAKAFELDNNQLNCKLDVSQIIKKPFSPSQIVNSVEDMFASVS